MKYIKLYEDLFKYEHAFLKCNYNDETQNGAHISKSFNGPNGIYNATKYAKEIIEEHSKFNKETGYITITISKDDITYRGLIKWWGNCNWEKLAEDKLENVYIYNKFLYGLEDAYDTYIANNSNVYNIIKYIKEKQPEMWKILLFHNPEIEKGNHMAQMGFGD